MNLLTKLDRMASKVGIGGTFRVDPNCMNVLREQIVTVVSGPFKDQHGPYWRVAGGDYSDYGVREEDLLIP